MEDRNWKLDAGAFCIIGLRSKGGPAGAPHRLGAEWVDFLSRQERFGQFAIAFGPFQEKPELHAEVAEGRIGNAKAVLVKPTTTTNSVGKCIRALKQVGLTADNLILVYDDCSISPGRYKSVFGRSSRAAGHRGVLAVETEVGLAFGRLKIGIGPIQGDVDEFFTQQHEQANLIQSKFVNLLQLLLGLHTVYPRCKSQNALPELVQKWEAYWEDGGQAELRSRLDKLADKDSISPHPVFLPRSVQKQAYSLWGFLLRVMNQANARYSAAIKKQDQDPIIQLLEQGVPRVLLPAVRSNSLQLNHMRLDAHLAEYNGKPVLQVIELNAAPGGLALDQSSRELFQGIPALEGLELATCSTAQLLLRYGLKPLLRKGNVVALIGRAGGHTFGKAGNPLMGHLLTAAGVHVLTDLTCAQLGYDPQLGLRHKGERIGLLFALTNYGVEERANSIMSPAVAKALAENAVSIFPSPRNLLFASKGFLAVLSCPEKRAILGVNEKQWQKRYKLYFPWCRVWDEQTAETVEAMRRAGVSFVRKPFFGSGGRGVEILGPMAFHHEAKGFNSGPAVAQLHVPPPVLPSNPKLCYDLLLPVYTEQGGQIQAMPIQTRIFSGEKVTLSSAGGGAGAVFLYDD